VGDGFETVTKVSGVAVGFTVGPEVAATETGSATTDISLENALAPQYLLAPTTK